MYIIDRNGDIYYLFDEDYYSYHAGNAYANKYAVSYELVNWLQLTKVGNTFKNWTGGIVPSDQVVDLGKPWRGLRYFHKPTEIQIEAWKMLVNQTCDRHKNTKSSS